MAKVRERVLSPEERGVLPHPLTVGPSVQHFAPDDFRRHPSPPSDQDTMMAIMLRARRTYNTYFRRWANDVGMTWDEAKSHVVHRRPYWP